MQRVLKWGTAFFFVVVYAAQAATDKDRKTEQLAIDLHPNGWFGIVLEAPSVDGACKEIPANANPRQAMAALAKARGGKYRFESGGYIKNSGFALTYFLNETPFIFATSEEICKGIYSSIRTQLLRAP